MKSIFLPFKTCKGKNFYTEDDQRLAVSLSCIATAPMPPLKHSPPHLSQTTTTAVSISLPLTRLARFKDGDGHNDGGDAEA